MTGQRCDHWAEVARELAEQIAADLFVNGQGKEAVRLQLRIADWSDGVPGERDGGGWCRAAVVDRIAAKLESHFRGCGPCGP